jgi:hypothetical protein
LYARVVRSMIVFWGCAVQWCLHDLLTYHQTIFMISVAQVFA